jgi:hypothetical protein
VLHISVHAAFDGTRQESGAFDEQQAPPAAPATRRPSCAASLGASDDGGAVAWAGGTRSYASFDYGWLQVRARRGRFVITFIVACLGNACAFCDAVRRAATCTSAAARPAFVCSLLRRCTPRAPLHNAPQLNVCPEEVFDKRLR